MDLGEPKPKEITRNLTQKTYSYKKSLILLYNTILNYMFLNFLYLCNFSVQVFLPKNIGTRI